jgi:hypothetical protein
MNRARGLLALLVLALAGLGGLAHAHEVRPGFLQIREIAPATYDVLWKTPAQGDLRLGLNVLMPAACRPAGPIRMVAVDGAAVQRWRIACAGGLPGKRVAVEHLDASLTDVILRFEPLAGAPKTLRLNGAAPAAAIPSRQSVWSVAATYFRLGVEHILLGFDHLLFVLCLLSLVGGVRRLIGAVTAFTVAHSITLAGATFGWLSLAAAPVEACIALSIAFVAAEIVRARQDRPGAMQRWPWIAAFAFGLLHGFGFASSLRQIGLPEDSLPLALLSFNLGVEAGQVLFVGVVLALLAVYRRYAPAPPKWAWRATPYLAGVIACFWFLERTARIFQS